MRLATSFLAILILVLPGLGQAGSTGDIRGTVADPSNSRIAGGIVALVNDATGFRYEQTTDSQGQFDFELLPPGAYTARVTAEGMSPQLSQNLRVTVGGANDAGRGAGERHGLR